MTFPADQRRPARAPLLALTMGDPAGIGLETTIAVWRAQRSTGTAPPYALLFYGDPLALADAALRAGAPDPVALVAGPREAHALWPERIPVCPIPLARPAEPGRPDVANAPATIASIEAAVAAVVRGEAEALVTNPVAKSVLHAAGFSHPGHTEFLGELARRLAGGGPWRPVMLLAADELKIVPLTVHVPLAEVPRLVTRDLLVHAVATLEQSLLAEFALGTAGERPRIAVAGLNPHAGEAGSMGGEEQLVIAPAIAELRAQGYAVSGPHPADTMFHAAARTGYDAAVAMYHDQALIPIKTLAFDRAVNVTLGLPFVRTSPDHGTAFDIAGTGRARASSLAAALALAARLARNRAAGLPAAAP